MEDYVLEMKHITKSFSGNTVLRDVNFSLKRGEVHALLGENGAGKSTLMKILMGIYHMDEGEILVEGKPVRIGSAHQALQLGIAMIHQELNPILDMSIAENIFLGREISSRGLANKKAMTAEAQKLMKDVGLDLPASATMRELSIAQMQMVEIIKAISWKAKVIIMDEPTASLTDREVEILFHLIRKLAYDGVSVIFISHKMDEIFMITDRITVLRDGRYISTETTLETSRDKLISLMVGRSVDSYYPKQESRFGDYILNVRNLSVPGRVHDVSFDVRRGEILGIVGLVGAGRSEMMEAIFGLRKKSSGSIYIHNKEVKINSPRDAIAHRIAFVTEDRKVTGLNLVGNVRENITIVSIKKLLKNGLIDRKKEAARAGDYIDKLSIKTKSMEEDVSNLSGGNQQKTAIAKWLMSDPEIIIMDEPTRGIDVGAKMEIYTLITDLAAGYGMAVIMISSEMQEVISLSDRIMVLSDGKCMGFLERDEFDSERLMQMQFGNKQN